MQTFINLPPLIEAATTTILSRGNMRAIIATAQELHERYMTPEAERSQIIVRKPEDALAYLALRFPATYAQISGALSQVQERIPDWQPKTVLDVGCGPGTGMMAAKATWPSLASGFGVDQVQALLSLGEELLFESKLDIAVTWERASLINWIHTTDTQTYDLIIVANVLNELPGALKEQLLQVLVKKCSGVIVLVEPGTSAGFTLIQRCTKLFAASQKLIAPYIDNTFVPSDDYWIHFSQRFQRPEFLRMVRQSARDSGLMASDWEDATYCYVAFGSVPVTRPIWGQCIGKVSKYKGYLTVPVLTREGILQARILKRHKKEYTMAKNVRWGELFEGPITTS